MPGLRAIAWIVPNLGSGRLMALERIAVMTALNLSDELLRLQKHEQHRKDTLDSRIRMLADELDDALGE